MALVSQEIMVGAYFVKKQYYIYVNDIISPCRDLGFSQIIHILYTRDFNASLYSNEIDCVPILLTTTL